MLDVLCIGNATLDVFIQINKKNTNKNMVCLPLDGKIEAKKISYETGGGATNTSVGFTRMGLKTGILSMVGFDQSGTAILNNLKKEKILTDLILKDKKHNTSYSAIITGFGRDRVILTYSGAAKHVSEKNLPFTKMNSKWFYISSLHAKPKALKKIFDFAQKNKIKIAWNPGKIELKQGLKKLKPFLKKVNVLLINSSEAKVLTKKNVLKSLKILSEFVKIVVITDGNKGVHVLSGEKHFFQKPYKIKIKDTTGAGDSFNSAFVSALFYGKSLNTALNWGMVNAQSVIQFIGAKNKLLKKKEMVSFIKKHKRTKIVTKILKK